MKIIALTVAGLAAAATLSPIAATAQTRTVTTHTESHSYSRPVHHTRQKCTVRFEHHRKVRTCRTVRF